MTAKMKYLRCAIKRLVMEKAYKDKLLILRLFFSVLSMSYALETGKM